MNYLEKQEKLSELISEGEKDLALDLLKSWSEQTSFKEVIFNIMEPMLEKWGKLWMQGKISLAHGYVSGKVAEEFYLLATSDREFFKELPEKKGTIILGNVEDDFHPLGRKLVSIYTKAAGWNIIDLGVDVPAETFVEKAIEHDADIIAVSAMMFTTAQNILKIRKQIDESQLSNKVKLALGGAIFKIRPELVKELGGDGTAENAIHAPKLFDSLLKGG